MGSTRRAFIRQAGIALASAMVAGCTWICAPFKARGETPRERLRSCWLGLDWLVEQEQECSDEARAQLRAAHRAALDELVGEGELPADVGTYVQSAFDEAVSHIMRGKSLVTCYEMVGLPYYRFKSRGKLIEQADRLAEIASRGSLDPETVAQAQAAIERDIAFLGLSPPELETLDDGLADGDVLSFEEIDLEITPQAVTATRFLVELLLGQ